MTSHCGETSIGQEMPSQAQKLDLNLICTFSIQTSYDPCRLCEDHQLMKKHVTATATVPCNIHASGNGVMRHQFLAAVASSQEQTGFRVSEWMNAMAMAL